MKKIKPAIKCLGEKHSICDWIISHFPEKYEEMTYLEPFGGSANVLLNKKKSKIEVLNDSCKDLVKIYQALRDEPREFYRKLSHYKYCEITFQKALQKNEFDDYLEEAINQFILVKMSRNGLKDKFAIKNQTTWKSCVKNVLSVSERIEDTFIFNKSPFEIIKTFNHKDTLIYCNPPYLVETKTAKSIYNSELKPEDHIKLSHILNSFKGKVLLSGCVSPLYKRLYKNWNLDKKKDVENSKSESLWRNF